MIILQVPPHELRQGDKLFLTDIRRVAVVAPNDYCDEEGTVYNGYITITLRVGDEKFVYYHKRDGNYRYNLILNKEGIC